MEFLCHRTNGRTRIFGDEVQMAAFPAIKSKSLAVESSVRFWTSLDFKFLTSFESFFTVAPDQPSLTNLGELTS